MTLLWKVLLVSMLQLNLNLSGPGSGGSQLQQWQLYPYLYIEKPDITSPFTMNDGNEIILVVTKDEKYGLVPVKVENGGPLHYSKRTGTVMGKDQQLEINRWDFPALAANGLHDEAELDNKEMITGFPVRVITFTGRPGGYTESGFMAADEDIISVLKGDNRLVRSMKLTHPQMAKPLFHLWNLILTEIELKKFVRYYDNVKYVWYNGNRLTFKAVGTKGWQCSIFQDEIQGKFDFDIARELTSDELVFLKKKYPHLTEEQFSELISKISSVHFSEMLPYYIMRYGFYEGHNPYRCDPVALAYIFGFKSLTELDTVFGGKLYEALTSHFISPEEK